MCPLRYVLVLVSVLIALLLLWHPKDFALGAGLEGSEVDEAVETEGDGKVGGKVAARGKGGGEGRITGRKGLLDLLCDFSTGRYLYRVYRSSVKQQEALALANAGEDD